MISFFMMNGCIHTLVTHRFSWIKHGYLHQIHDRISNFLVNSILSIQCTQCNDELRDDHTIWRGNGILIDVFPI